MENSIDYYGQQKEFHLKVSKAYPILVNYKNEGKKAEFNELLMELLPQVKKYINRRLINAIKKNHVPKGKYKPDDILDQLFIEVYDHIGAIEYGHDLHPWLFIKADELMAETIADEEFEYRFIENLDTFSEPEWKEMEEKFSTDGDGDLVMIEELDDLSYHKNDYTLDHVFVENKEREMLEKLDRKLSDENSKRQIKIILHNLPSPMRTVFELFNDQHFTLGEIARIRRITVEEVEDLLNTARKNIQVGIFNRFSN